jgi:hypothetical protein
MASVTTTPLTLALSAQEFEKLRDQAARLGLEPAELARALLGASLLTRSGPGLGEVVGEVRAQNAADPIDPDQILAEAYEELRLMRRAREG